MTTLRFGLLAGVALAAALAACAGGPPPPDWQANARSAIDRAVAAHLLGDTRAEAQEFALARSEVARTGRMDLLARVELTRCAARVASLAFGPCEGFEALRGDAAAGEIAYADHLAARPPTRERIALLPAAQQPAARAIAGGEVSLSSLRNIEPALSRLLAVALLFQSGKASPEMIALAVDTASAQGWRRPLLAWLEVQALHAERGGSAGEAQRIRRRMDAVQSAR